MFFARVLRAHEVEGAVGRDERDGAVVLKARQAHALVELDVLHLHALVLPAAPLGLEQHLRMEASGHSLTVHATLPWTVQEPACSRPRALSFRPSLHSGMPERKVRILSAPMTSERTTEPLLFTSRFTLSTTSRNTSFFLNLHMRRGDQQCTRRCTCMCRSLPTQHALEAFAAP